MRSDLALPHRHLSALAERVADIGEPCWISDVIAGAIRGFDGFELRPPFHILTARDRNVRRIGHVRHTTHEIPLIDRGTKYGLPVLSATRTLIDIARSIGPEALTAALDSAIRDGLIHSSAVHLLPGCRGRRHDAANDPHGVRPLRARRSREDMNRLHVSVLTETT